MSAIGRATLRELWRRGAIGELLPPDGDLATALENTEDHECPDPVERSALKAHLCLIMLNPGAAYGVLGPLLGDGSGSLDERRIRDAGARSDRLGFLLLLNQAISYCYRSLRDEKIELVIRVARDAVARAAEHVSRLDLALVTAELSFVSARLPDRRNLMGDSLDAAILRLRSLRGEVEPGETGGIDLALAVLLDLAASQEWRGRSLRRARELSFESIALLESGSACDPVRLAVAMSTAARIEATRSDDGFATAIEWSRRSEAIFQRLRHPFVWRPIIQRAQCHIKADRLDDARRALGDVREALARITLDETQERFAQAEIDMSFAWIAQREVRSRSSERETWERHSRSMVQQEKGIPSRLQAEGALQLGLCLSQKASSNGKDEAVKHIRDALAIAESGGRQKTVAACHLGLAESYLSNDLPAAQREWQAAQQALSGTGSSYVEKWAEDLAKRLDGPLTYSPKMSWKDVQKTVKREYFSFHHAKCEGSVDRIATETRLAPSYVYKVLRELRLEARGKE